MAARRFRCRPYSIEQSAEQTRAGVRYKPPKSGRARTVAMGAMVAGELRARRMAQADTFVVAQADGSPVQPNTLTHNWVIEWAKTGLPRIRLVSGWGTARSG